MNISELYRKLEFDKILLSLSGHCCSQLGVEKCSSPDFFTDRDSLINELTKVSVLKGLIERDGVIDFSGIKDIRDILEKIRIPGNHVSAEKYLWILEFLRTSRRINSFLRSAEDEHPEINVIISISGKLFSDRILENKIDSTISSEGEVKDSASPELRKIRKTLIEKRELLRKMLGKILRNVTQQDLSREEIITMRDGRSVIPVKVENKRKVSGIIHSASSSGATVFIEPSETIEINNDITELQFRENREIEKILILLSEQISEFYFQISESCDIMGEIDFLHSKALYAIELNAFVPVISDDAFHLADAYHPVLLKTKGRSQVIPLDFLLEKGKNTVIITGPNAGGKTVALKTIGLLQLMFQSGLMIPASPLSELKVFENLFVNIGDEQSIENDLSSFSSHLKGIREIEKSAAGLSLILIDEICSGTDPKFGSVLAASILKHFNDRKYITVVTTHIGDLKSFAYNTPGFMNASLEFDIEHINPTFRFVSGVPGQSFTFEIAGKFEFPENILKFARSMLSDESYNLEVLIAELNKVKHDYLSLTNDNNKENARLNRLISEYDSKAAEIKRNEKLIINEAKSSAERILENGRKLIEKTIKEIRENQKFNAGRIKDDYNKAVAKLTEKTEITEDTASEIFEIGDLVSVKNTNSKGKITELKTDTALVVSNGITLKIKTHDLLKIHGGKYKEETEDSYSVVLKDPAQTRLDIRGQYTDGIHDLLEKFIYDAHINSFTELEIVHGKGTGRLRSEVHKLLKKNKLVISFRLGNWNEGESGVTIVEIKKS